MIYLVEDDENIRELEVYALQSAGFEVKAFADGKSFFAVYDGSPSLCQLLLLDLMLPDMTGEEVLARLRGRGDDLPVIIVTAKSGELAAVRSLEGGADDHITKPFGVMELISRVKAVLRRVEGGPSGALCCGGISLDEQKRLVTVDGEPCELSYKEFELLKCLLLNRGIVLTRSRLMDLVWGVDYAGESRTVDMHIKTLRQKLGEDAASCLKTVRNVGYKIE